MLFLTFAFTLIAATGLMFLLIRVKSGEHGSLIKWLTYLLLFLAAGSLVCQLALGVKRLFRHGGRAERHSKTMYHHGKQHSACCDEEMNCGGEMDKQHGSMMHGGGEEGMHSESTTDTIDGKVIHKEIRVTEKKAP